MHANELNVLRQYGELASRALLVGLFIISAITGCVSVDTDGGAISSGIGTPTGTLPSDTITFSSDSTVTTDARWGDAKAHLKVSHVGNLRPFIGLTIAPAVDGLPCTEGMMSDSDSSVLELTCPIPPGNKTHAKPKLVVKARTYTPSLKVVLVDIPKGTLDVPVTECDAASTPKSGVALPQLCRVDPGSTMDVGKALEGVFGSAGPQLSTSYLGGSIAFLANDGTYLVSNRDDSAKATTGKVEATDEPWTYEEGYSFKVTNWVSSEPRANATSGTYFPFRENSLFGSYSLINALAVKASSVDGSWYSGDDFGTSLKIVVSGDTGTITGITGGELNQPSACTFSGTISLHERNSSKNFFDITLTIAQASDTPQSEAATCEHTLDTELKGFAAITFNNAGTQDNPVYAYALEFAVGTSDSSAFQRRLTKQ